MANLTFTKVGGKWQGTFTATKNFNLHIEGAGDLVSVYQRTGSGATAYCIVADAQGTGDCYDRDFGNYVYPKSIKVVCDKQPGVAVITEEDS